MGLPQPDCHPPRRRHRIGASLLLNKVHIAINAGKKLAAESVKGIRAEETHIRYEEVNMLKKRFKSRQVWKVTFELSKSELLEDKDV